MDNHGIYRRGHVCESGAHRASDRERHGEGTREKAVWTCSAMITMESISSSGFLLLRLQNSDCDGRGSEDTSIHLSPACSSDQRRTRNCARRECCVYVDSHSPFHMLRCAFRPPSCEAMSRGEECSRLSGMRPACVSGGIPPRGPRLFVIHGVHSE
ncbi:uncharacterized protein BDZ99DRAFT_108037 [Mytilinidion resinicola]|uniref:Uncharacterized protein n=1 Tax=Mytilinidion resinicola TaxID=574789 RepID=A0A6A6Y9W9_9PEZI|nr:uncharacterized protein BDZ99DRAFT_108037 [Mytilinidion resinicola]KAF2805611.1 hypothetical protein BDZ99DRAFT_108037 [Mytilinidion resinicola]